MRLITSSVLLLLLLSSGLVAVLNVKSTQSQSSGAQDSVTITGVYLAVFENDGSPYNGYFHTLLINGSSAGPDSITSIDVHLAGADLGAPPLCCNFGGGGPWLADYTALPLSISMGQTYQIAVLVILSNGEPFSASFAATAVTCDSLLACPGSTPIAKTSIVLSADCVTSDPANDFANQQVPLAYGVAQTNPWNIHSAQGSVSLCYRPSTGLSASVTLTDVQLSRSGVPVVGYSEAAYGDNLEGDPFGSQLAGFPAFPVQTLTLKSEDLWANVSYAVDNGFSAQMDAGYDIWIKAQQSGTPVSTDFELLVLPFDSYLRACLTRSNYSNLIYVDSKPDPVTWKVCNQPGSGGAALYVFSLEPQFEVLSGNVALKPYDMISYLATDTTNTPLANYWVMGIEFGTEFAAQQVPPTTMNWAISEFSLNTATSPVYIIPPATTSSSSTTAVSSQGSSLNTNGTGGIPEFPNQAFVASVFTAILTLSYLTLRRHFRKA